MLMWSKETKSLKRDEWLLVNRAIVSDNVCAFGFSFQLWSEAHSLRLQNPIRDIAVTATGKICVHCKSPHAFFIEVSRFKNITRTGPAIGLLQGGLLQFSFPLSKRELETNYFKYKPLKTISSSFHLLLDDCHNYIVPIQQAWIPHTY